MFDYYTEIIILLWMALGILCLLAWENDRLAPAGKRLLYLTYILIALSSLAEWCGVQLNGRTDYPVWALKTAKCADFILTPMAGGVLAMQVQPKGLWRKALIGVLAGNTLLQLVSFFTGWMITVDEGQHYLHGPAYPVYMALCLLIIAFMISSFIYYGRQFRRHNQKSLYAIVAFILIGIWMQEGLPEKNRTAYVVLTIGAAMMYIHYEEFSSLKLGDQVAVQQIQIDTDVLTGMYSRYAYSQALTKLAEGRLPPELAAFTIDINGLKAVNDSLGHSAGDEMIVGAAECIRSVVGSAGRCYRTGGDEFVVLANMGREEAETLLKELKRETEQWRGKSVQSLSVAVGYALASAFPEFGIERLVREADMAMYAAKTEYYRAGGRDRRRAR